MRALQNGHQTIPVVPWAVDVLDHGPAHAVGPVVRVRVGVSLRVRARVRARGSGLAMLGKDWG